jgi:hypothetical protein
MPRFNKVRCDYLYVGRSGEFSARKLSADGVDAGQSGTAGIVKSFPATAAKGHLALTGVANDGDTATTISNAAMGQASVISIPDPGAATANFLLTSQGNDGSLVTATAAEINSICDASARVVDVTTPTLAIASATHAGRILAVDEATGCDLTLPAATGTGDVYTIILVTTVGSNTSTILVTGNDTFIGQIISSADDAASTAICWAATAGDNTITLDGSTTGGIAGDSFTITDVATDTWHIVGFTESTGTEATPFSTV